jgi:uncharacterized damage-inducible protein DinB
MAGPLADLARQFRFNDRFLGMLVEGYGETDWTFRPEGGGNGPDWIVGHLTATRRSLLRKLGETLATEAWETRYDMGVEPDATDDGPTPDELAAAFVELGEVLAGKLEALTPADAAREWENPFPDGATTLDGALRFLFFHETYHLGQLGLLRRMLGRPRFA